MKKVILTQDAPAPIGPYSQGIDTGSFVFFSGQIPLDPKNGAIVGDTVQEQTIQVMKNIGACLKAAGLDFRHVVKTNIFLTDMKDFTVVNEVYAPHFPTEPPARSTFAVAALPKGAKVEIEIVAQR